MTDKAGRVIAEYAEAFVARDLSAAVFARHIREQMAAGCGALGCVSRRPAGVARDATWARCRCGELLERALLETLAAALRSAPELLARLEVGEPARTDRR